MGAAEGMMTHRIQGEKKWDSSNLKFTGAFLSKLAGETDTVTITRVDKGLTWTLDPKKKTYTETPIKPVKMPASETTAAGGKTGKTNGSNHQIGIFGQKDRGRRNHQRLSL